MPADCVSIYRALSRPPPVAPPAAAAAVTRHLMLRVTDTSADSGAQLIYCQLYSERRDAWVSERWCGGGAGGGAGGGHTQGHGHTQSDGHMSHTVVTSSVTWAPTVPIQD